MAFFDSPLFKFAARELRDAAMSEFRQTDVYRLLQTAKGLKSQMAGMTPDAYQRRVEQAMRKYKSWTAQAGIRQLTRGNIGQAARQIQRYAKGDPAWEMVQDVLSQMGPIGQILRTLANPGGRVFGKSGTMDDDTRLATEILRAFGHEVLPPKKAGSIRDRERGIEAARQFLEEAGYTVIPPGSESPSEAGARARGRGRGPFGVPLVGKGGRPRSTVTIPTDEGQKRVKPDDPIVTGEMIPTPASSNVHSFGYRLESRTLYVRFRDHDPDAGYGQARANKPGPLYEYSNVPTRIFRSFQHASSKGGAVWDYLRIRGTVSGHQYDYRLAGIGVSTYVPRKATLLPEGEAYIPRSISVGGKTYQSRQDVTLLPRRGDPPNGFPPRDSRG
jgi:hypothetical protein